MKTWMMAGLVLLLAVTGGAAWADAYSAAVIADSPVAYFRLTETNGNYLSADNVYTGTVAGSVGRGVAGPSQYRGFDPHNVGALITNGLGPNWGVGSHFIQVPNTLAVNPGTHDFTMEAWVLIPQNYAEGGAGFIIGKAGAGYLGLRTKTVSGKNVVHAHIGGTNGHFFTTDVPLSTGIWHHVTAVFDRNPPGTEDTAIVYVDGLARGTTNSSILKVGGVPSGEPLDLQATFPLGIGALVTNNGTIWGFAMNGYVDEVAIYTQALSASQVSAHWNAALRGLFAAPSITDNLLIALQGNATITSSVGRVSSWLDQASLGGYQDFAQLTDALRPTWSREALPQGRPVGILTFDMTQTNYLELGASPVMDTNTWTWFMVFKPRCPYPPSASRWILMSGYTNGAGAYNAAASNMWGSALHANGSFQSFARSNALTGGFISQVTPANSNQWFVMSAVWNGTAAPVGGQPATTVKAWLQDETRTVYTLAATNGANATPAGHIWSRVGLTCHGILYPFDGKIAEILVYNTALSGEQVSAVEMYLVRKYLVSQLGVHFVIR